MKISFRKIIRLLLVLFIGVYILLTVYIQANAFKDTTKPADVIVVLGTRPSIDTPNPCLVARVKHAVSLYKRGLAPTLLFSGGKLRKDEKSEAEVMKEVALEFGMENQAMLLEPDSTSTYENLLFSKKILDSRKIKSVILISDPYHLPRASLIAKKLGIKYFISPAIESPCSRQVHNIVSYLVYEPMKMVFYKVSGKL